MIPHRSVFRSVQGRFLSFLLCVALLLSVLPVASADKAAGTLDGDLDGLFSWFYVTDSLPEGLSLRESRTTLHYIYRKGANPADTTGYERIIGVNAEFMSGDEFLRDAVRVDMEEKRTLNRATLAEERYLEVDVWVDNAKLTAPGTAVFNLTFESASYRVTKACTLRVLPLSEENAVTLTATDPLFRRRPGQSFVLGDLSRQMVSENFKNYCVANQLPCPYFGVSLSESTVPGLRYDTLSGAWLVEDYNLYNLNMNYYVSNVVWTLPFQVEALSYSITGPDFLLPGNSARYRINDEDAGAGRQFSWSVSGEGASVTENGTVTLAEGAPTGGKIRLTVSPENDPPLWREIRIPAGALPEIPEPSEDKEETEKGFIVPVFSGSKWETTVSPKRDSGWIFRSLAVAEDGASVIVDARTDALEGGFLESPEAAMAYYNSTGFNDSVVSIQRSDVLISGHPARIYTYTMTVNNMPYHFGEIDYCRNNQLLTYRVYTAKSNTAANLLVPVSMQEMETIAAMIRYDEEQAPVRQSDTALVLNTADDSPYLTVGRTKSFTASFVNHDAVLKYYGNTAGAVSWVVTDPADGLPSEHASISANGLLTVRSAEEMPYDLDITAASALFGTSASYRLTVVPPVTQLAMEPASVLLYLTEGSSAVLSAVIEPESVPAGILSWSVQHSSIAEVQPDGNGNAVVTPLAAGKTTVSVKEPGGRVRNTAVTVLEPVTGLEISVARGTPNAGKTLVMGVDIQPANAGDKTVVWSVDADPSVATIDRQRQLQIGKDVPPGTVINVICEATGAPEPIVATMDIVVE